MASWPWYKWFVESWFASETRHGMTIEERGLYRECLDLQAIEKSIPRDLNTLRRLLAADREEFDRAWPKVSTCFVPFLTDRLVNLRMKDVIDDREEVRGERAKAGAKGGKQSGKARRSKREANASILLKQKRSKNEAEEKRREGDTPKADTHTSFGEFGRCLLTPQEHAKLTERIGNQLPDYIERFDVWVEEAPGVKASGVPRSKRKAYNSIIAWFRRDQEKHGRNPATAGVMRNQTNGDEGWVPEEVKKAIKSTREFLADPELGTSARREEFAAFLRSGISKGGEVAEICRAELEGMEATGGKG